MQFKDQSKRKAITLSYDDGVVQDIRLVELLNKYGLKCTFNLNSHLFGRRGFINADGRRVCQYRIQKEDIPYVYDGHEVAVHTLTHPLLTELSEDALIYEVEQDRENLSQLVGYDVVGMAYPCGKIDDRVVDILRNKTNIQYSRTTMVTESFAPQTDLLRFQANAHHLSFEHMAKLATRFLASTDECPQILYIWGHAYEMDYESENWSKLEQFFQLISGHDDVFYGTNAQVLL